MIRAAAKNHAFRAPIVRPDRYAEVLEELQGSGCRLSSGTRQELAAEAFEHTARYDEMIAQWFATQVEAGALAGA